MSTPSRPNAERVDLLRARLSAALHTERVEVVDESHLHVGHPGAREGKGHFRVLIVSDDFAGLRPLARHQLVYRSLGELMQTDIHALSITALTPKEAASS
ncbi:MAG: BolA family transcriptional regulator [Proteobacteria bacterium]|nr:MAG: BolA family transcriptional regulator [Pseudomonadota bacterium]